MLWLRSALFGTAFVGMFFVLVPRWILAGSGNPAALAGFPLVGGLLLIVVGFALALWCLSVFVRYGRGTPAPFDPPRQLVVRGPYRFVRNPMYIGGILMLLGEALIFASIPLVEYGAILWFSVHVFVVIYEEPTLKRSFGDSYSEYRARVGRWIPGRRFQPSATG